MKIAIIATGASIESNVAKWMHQNGYLLIIDPETLNCQAMQNPLTQARGPAVGKLLTQILLQNNVWAVIAENGEFKILKELADANIQIQVGITGTVRNAVEQFKYSYCTVAV
jgi:predicted Fe-Mo cluster-binding NifX family protein